MEDGACRGRVSHRQGDLAGVAAEDRTGGLGSPFLDPHLPDEGLQSGRTSRVVDHGGVVTDIVAEVFLDHVPDRPEAGDLPVCMRRQVLQSAAIDPMLWLTRRIVFPSRATSPNRPIHL